MSKLTNNIARFEKHLKKLHPGTIMVGPITDLWKMYHEALDHASTPLEYNAIQNWGLIDLVEFIGHQRRNQDARNNVNSDFDEELELSLKATELGIRLETLRNWQKIKIYMDHGLSRSKMAERLGKSLETIRDNIKKMRAKEYIKG